MAEPHLGLGLLVEELDVGELQAPRQPVLQPPWAPAHATPSTMDTREASPACSIKVCHVFSAIGLNLGRI